MIFLCWYYNPMHISSCISIHQRRLVHRNYFRVLFDALTYTNVDKIKDTILKTLQAVKTESQFLKCTVWRR